MFPINQPLEGKSPFHISSLQYFVKVIKLVKLEPGDNVLGFDAEKLYTIAAVEESLKLISVKNSFCIITSHRTKKKSLLMFNSRRSCILLLKYVKIDSIVQ